jgi:hypothetical protein
MPALKPRELRTIVTYPRDAVLDASHLGAAFGVSEEIIAKMDLPSFLAGARQKYIWGQVIDHLTAIANPDAIAHVRRRKTA